MANVKVFGRTEYLTFDLEEWPWPSPFITQNVQLQEIPMHAKYQVAIINSEQVMANVKVFGWTDRRHILDIWPSPFTTQNVQPQEIHIHAKYQIAIVNSEKVMTNVSFRTDGHMPYIRPLTLKDDLDLHLSPLKMCSSMRCTCMPNITVLC
jgi:hypothetical protein